MRLYLAGPTLGDRRLNGRPEALFERAAQLLRTDNHDVYSHHEHSEDLITDGVYDEQEVRERRGFQFSADLGVICGGADAVIVLHGWRDSLRGRAEVAVAQARHLPVYEITAFLFDGQKAPRVGRTD